MLNRVRKFCDSCQKTSLFRFRIVDGKRYLACKCVNCEAADRVQRRIGRDRSREYRQATRFRSGQRKANIDVDRWIHEDSRKSAKKKNLPHELTREAIRELISQPCHHCGETGLRMTLDRIDNDCGYVSTNVVPACIRCNYTRRDMPWEAWVVLSKSMRAAREAGLFAEWTGRVR